MRLNAVVNSAQQPQPDVDLRHRLHGGDADTLGDLIISQIGAGCLNSPIANRADGTPDCVVTDVTAQPDGSTTRRRKCRRAPRTVTRVPCWQVINKLTEYNSRAARHQSPVSPTTCKLPSTCQPVANPVDGTKQLVTVSIDRGTDSTGKPNDAPPGTTANVSCATIASLDVIVASAATS